EKKMVARGKYIIRHTSKECKCIVKEAKYKLDINTLQRIEDDVEIGLNDIGRVTLRTTVPLFFDSYRKNRITGSIILVDEATNETVAAGMMV
ncbi:MAG TPA: sulfate adenylyltransferase, partial [Chitinophagales bacterium]|nr:sulfate adenylyltransferase [Chitinophagales bacterium]